jgi:hypothetical protein
VVGIMARIFQKYVTPEGRTEVSPEVEPEYPIEDDSNPFEEEDKPTTTLQFGGNAIKMSDIDTGGRTPNVAKEKEPSIVDVESAISMYLVMNGIRKMMQSFREMSL